MVCFIRFGQGLCFSLLGLVLFSLSARAQITGPCIVHRGAIDIGTELVKLKVAKVNACIGLIENILLEKELRVALGEGLSQSATKNISKDLMKQLKESLLILRDLAKEKFPDVQFRGVSSAAFDEARNFKELSLAWQDAGLTIYPLTDQDEGRLWVYAAAYGLRRDVHKLIIWDVGGTKVRIAFSPGKDQFYATQSKTGAVEFKNLVLHEIKKNPHLESPNPLTEEEATKTLELSKKLAQTLATPETVARLMDPHLEVIGTGGVFLHGQDFRGSGLRMSLDVIRSRFFAKKTMTDLTIGGPYPGTEITSLALIAGHMETLKIKEVRPMKLSLTDGILLYPGFWFPKKN